MKESDYYESLGARQETAMRHQNAAASGVAEVPFGAPPKRVCVAIRKDGNKCLNSPLGKRDTCIGHVRSDTDG